MQLSGPDHITLLLQNAFQGDKQAEAELAPLVVHELRRIAAKRLHREAAGHSLQPTALVNEAYMRLARLDRIRWQNRAHFFAVAAGIMRQILVDHARGRLAEKRGGGAVRVVLEPDIAAVAEPAAEVLALHEALERLALISQRQARVVELRFFAGLSDEESAAAMGISERTVKRDWRVAKAWLFDQLQGRAAVS
jgi:RNA polymerase sigma-70 factor, ECF subfamily